MTYQDLCKRRLKQLLTTLSKQAGPSALLVSSGPYLASSRDQLFPYRQDSNFFFLTGCEEPGLALLLTTTKKKPILFARKVSNLQRIWDGPGADVSKLAKQLGCELRTIDGNKFQNEILSELSGIEVLFYQNNHASVGTKIAQQLFETPSHLSHKLPKTFSNLEILIEPLRLKKEPIEVELISKAAAITNQALFAIADDISMLETEVYYAARAEQIFKAHGGDTAFNTIVASGASAATLHHSPKLRKLKNNELVLIDLGASYQLHAADITRMLPVSGRFNETSRLVYQTVLDAQAAAISKIKSGVLVRTVYRAAAKELVEGLKRLKVLKGNTASLVDSPEFKQYFPHGIGHTLGLDTHDVGNFRGNQEAILEAGMVFTIEPGLYFRKKVANLTPMGIRIEDDILVTKTGCKILSSGFPKEIEEIEGLF